MHGRVSSSLASSEHVALTAWGCLEKIRAARPRVHCLTNAVAQAYTANLLLAAGAIPSMTVSEDEIGAFVQSADALVINLGTFDAQRRASALIAIEAATVAGRPWLLDPVLIDRSPLRAEFARRLIGLNPQIVRSNRAEAMALFGAHALVQPGWAGPVLALTGPVDAVRAASGAFEIPNGHMLMDRVTAMGCAGTALMAAFAAVEADMQLAAAGALVVLGIAGEIAAEKANGPGSYAAAYLDALDGLDRSTIIDRARVT